VRIEEVTGGFAVEGTFPDHEVVEFIAKTAGPLPLIIADPPYGNIVADGWDRVDLDDVTFADWMVSWTFICQKLSVPRAALFVWGGIGKPGFRPFYRYLIEAEGQTGYQLANHITWGKKRAYGIQHNLLFCREELAYFLLGDDITKPRVFNVPYLDQKRGYAGFNKKYPAKSEFLRRTNVWTDITEILRGKIHTAQKPERLHEVIIEMSTNKGEWVLDPFSGSGTTGLAARKLGRPFILVEKDPVEFEKGLKRLRG
jgi:DNA modification methylase